MRDTVGIPVDMSWCTGVYLHRRIGTQVYIKTHYKIKQKNFLSTPSHVVPVVHAQLILIYLVYFIPAVPTHSFFSIPTKRRSAASAKLIC